MNAREIAESNLPGADLVSKGQIDLGNQEATAEALLVLVAAPRLRRLGISTPEFAAVARPYEHALNSVLEETHGAGAHSQ